MVVTAAETHLRVSKLIWKRVSLWITGDPTNAALHRKLFVWRDCIPTCTFAP